MSTDVEFDEVRARAEAIERDGCGLPELLGMETTEIGPGTITCTIKVQDQIVTAWGMIHGGVISALVDHVLGAVCYPVIPEGWWSATVEYKLNFLAPVSTGVLEARAEILSQTKRTAIIRIDVSNDDKAVALAQGTVMLMPPRPAA